MALPTEVTQQRGMKDTSDPISQEKPLAIGRKIWKYNVNKNKALNSVLAASKSEPVYNSTFGHIERVPLAYIIEYTGTAESSQGTTGLVFRSGTGERVILGGRAYFPRIEEIIRFGVAFASTTTSAAVTRNHGRGVATTSLLKPGDKGILLTPHFEEGFTTPDGITLNGVYKTFYTSEVAFPIKLSNIEAAERSRVGNPFKVALDDTIELSKTLMENELLFGGKVSTTVGGVPMKAAEGIDNFITTNVYSMNYLTRLDFFSILAEWNLYNKGPGDIWCSFAFKAMVSEWAMSMSTITIPITGQSGQGKLGMVIDVIKTTHGEYRLIDVDVLGMEEYLMGKAFLVPRGKIQYHPLIENLNLDIAYNPISRDEVHAKEGEVYGVYGWEYFEEETWGKIEDVQFT